MSSVVSTPSRKLIYEMQPFLSDNATLEPFKNTPQATKKPGKNLTKYNDGALELRKKNKIKG